MTHKELAVVDHLFIGPLYRSASTETRAQVDRLLGIEPGHRDSNQIVVGYCKAKPVTRRQIEELLEFSPGELGGDDS